MEADNALALHHLGALDLFNELWNRMQKPDGTPKDVTNNELLMMLFEEMRRQAVVQSRHEQHLDELRNIIGDHQNQIYDLVSQLSNARESGQRTGERRLLMALKYDFDIEPEAAAALMETITEGSIPDDMPNYVLTALRKAFSTFEAEFIEARDMNALNTDKEEVNDDL